MSEPSSPAQATSAAWRAAWLSLLFLFDVARISRGRGDLLEPVIITAILQGNQAALQGDPELQLRYKDSAWALPDALRRPISINAVAQSLRLPFETVRRRAQALAARGVCVMTSAGVYVPQAAVTSAAYVDVQARRVERLATLYADLVVAGLQATKPGLEDFLAASGRAADRLLADYMLRAVGAILELTTGAVDGVVVLALSAVNIAPLDPAAVIAEGRYAEAARPCSAGQVAHALGMPRETVRRRLHGLAEIGFCRRVGRLWIADVPPASQPLLARLVAENTQNLRRLFSALGELSERAQPS